MQRDPPCSIRSTEVPKPNSIRQHRPAYFSGFENETVPFGTVEELLAIPFVANFRESNVKPFHRFSLDENRLMVEYDGGREWWVVGYIDNPLALGLPVWEPVRENAGVAH